MDTTLIHITILVIIGYGFCYTRSDKLRDLFTWLFHIYFIVGTAYLLAGGL